MPEIGTSGSTSGDGKRSVAARPKRPRPSSTPPLYLREGEAFRAVSMHGATPDYLQSRLGQLVHPGPGTGLGRAVRTKQAVHIADRRAGVSGARSHACRSGGPGRRSDNAQCADAQGG